MVSPSPERPTADSPSPTATAPREDERPPADRSGRLGFAEWIVGLGLLIGSLPGPWLTLMSPAALAFALHDRRVGLRALALVALAVCVLLTLAAPGGLALLAIGAGAAGAGFAWIASGRSGAMDAIAPAALAGAGVGWGFARLVAPAAVAAWESMLGRGVAEGGRAALDRYQDFGMDPQALAVLDGALVTLVVWMVRLWPALAALSLWLGVWLSGRILARWGRIVPALRHRLAKRPFATFAVGESFAWLLIAALAGFWGGRALAEPAIEEVAVNAALVAIVLFALDGAAVAWWWLDRRRVSIGLRVAAIVLVVVFALPVAISGAVAIGLADHWIQFRNRPQRATAAGPSHR
jgi:hypothetical protein